MIVVAGGGRMVPLLFEEQTSTKTQISFSLRCLLVQQIALASYSKNFVVTDVNPSIAADSQKASFKYFALHVHHKLVGLSPTFETATYA